MQRWAERAVFSAANWKGRGMWRYLGDLRRTGREMDVETAQILRNNKRTEMTLRDVCKELVPNFIGILSLALVIGKQSNLMCYQN